MAVVPLHQQSKGLGKFKWIACSFIGIAINASELQIPTIICAASTKCNNMINLISSTQAFSAISTFALLKTPNCSNVSSRVTAFSIFFQGFAIASMLTFEIAVTLKPPFIFGSLSLWMFGAIITFFLAVFFSAGRAPAPHAFFAAFCHRTFYVVPNIFASERK